MSQSPMVGRILTTVETNQIAAGDMQIYEPQLEAIVLGVMRAISSDTLMAGQAAANAIINAQVALAATDPV